MRFVETESECWPVPCAVCAKEFGDPKETDSLTTYEAKPQNDADWSFLERVGLDAGEAFCSARLKTLEAREDFPRLLGREEEREYRTQIRMEEYRRSRPQEYDKRRVRIRSAFDDWCVAEAPLGLIVGLHFDDFSGGVRAQAPTPFLSGYVPCVEIEGDIAHSCQHGPPPHDIKVVILRKDNDEICDEIVAEAASGKEQATR
jgi:hypothetical protein